METDLQQSDSAYKRSTMKSASSETKNTCVILVCIQNNSGVQITHDLLYTIFSPYGKILRILIFEKLKIWKAFVEYSTVEAAMNAKQTLNNFMIFNDGSRMTIHNANLETVKFQNNNPGGVDYTTSGNKNLSDSQDETNRANYNHGNIPQNHPQQHSQNYQMPNRIESFQHQHNTQDFSHDNLHKQHIDHGDSLKHHENMDEPISEEPSEGDEDEKNDFPSETFPSRSINSKTHIPHMHSVPSQHYRDSPSHSQQQQLQRNDSPTESSLPPGLMIPQRNLPQGPQGMPRLTRIPQTQSMNFIPLSTSDKQYSHGQLPNPTPIGAPLTRLTSFGSHNSLTMPSGPSNTSYNHPLQENIPQLEQMNTGPTLLQRPQLNKPFYSQQELPMMNSLNKERIPTINSQGLVGLQSKQIGGRNQMGSFEYEDLSNLNRSTLDQLHQNLSMLLGKGGEETNQKSRVLYIKGLEGKDIKVDMLYNIFSNFGNILKILFIPSKTSALIEFENAEYSTICMDYLNNIVFMGKPLRIYYSKYSIINLRNKKGEEPGEEIFIGSQKTNRFKKNKNISINPPSSTLHLSNLLKEACNEETIRAHFNAYGRIEAVKFILMENNKNMCLLRMASLEESLNAMAYLHDTNIDGRNVQISFTRSKI